MAETHDGAAVVIPALFSDQMANIQHIRARVILAKMKTILAAAPEALHQLCETRVPCPAAVEATGCPAVPFGNADGTLSLGMLGVINGLMPPGWRLAGQYGEGPDGKLQDFWLLKLEPDQPKEPIQEDLTGGQAQG